MSQISPTSVATASPFERDTILTDSDLELLERHPSLYDACDDSAFGVAILTRIADVDFSLTRRDNGNFDSLINETSQQGLDIHKIARSHIRDLPLVKNDEIVGFDLMMRKLRTDGFLCSGLSRALTGANVNIDNIDKPQDETDKDKATSIYFLRLLEIAYEVGTSLDEPLDARSLIDTDSRSAISELFSLCRPGLGLTGDEIIPYLASYENLKDRISDNDESIVQFAALVNIVRAVSKADINRIDKGVLFNSLLEGKENIASFSAKKIFKAHKKGFIFRNKQTVEEAAELESTLENIGVFFASRDASEKLLKVRIQNAAIQRVKTENRFNTYNVILSKLGVVTEWINEDSQDSPLTLMEKLHLDDIRSRIASNLILAKLNIGGTPEFSKIVEYSEKPLHRFIDSQALTEQLHEVESALADIDTRIAIQDAEYKVTSKIVREIPNGTDRRKTISECLARKNEPQIPDRVIDQLLVIANTVLSSPENTQTQVDSLVRVLDTLQRLEQSVAYLGRRNTSSNVLRAINTLHELVETHGESVINDAQITHLYRLLNNEPDDFQITPEATMPDEISDELFNEIAMLPEENLEIFPPAIGGLDEVVDQFIEILETEQHGQSYLDRIEWGRIENMVKLRDSLNERSNVASELKISRSSAWSPMPFFILETIINDRTVAIVESPLYRNATYVVHDDEWRDIVTLTRDEAKVLGAVPKVHSTDHETHRHKLYTAVLFR
jgi:hypothetical protein